jgi:hypothetical protein
MDFHLSFPIKPFESKLNYKQKLLFVGSCFAENIGELMQQSKFDTVLNSHGIIYNPQSISIAIQRYISNELYTEGDLFYANECWNSWEHHSRFSHPNKETCLAELNTQLNTAHHQLKQADWLFITLGSSFIYKHIESNQLVGNCHKVPQQQFEKLFLNSLDVIAEYKILIEKLKDFNPKLKIVFTVSPVRYVRDGVVENNLSKAHLLATVHQLVNDYSNLYYFPAYELVIDDLRDYRFYKADMVHPNQQAIDYVFQKLKEALFDSETIDAFEKVNDILRASAHRPFNNDSEEFKKFKSTYLKRCKELQEKNPTIDLKKEEAYFS